MCIFRPFFLGGGIVYTSLCKESEPPDVLICTILAVAGNRGRFWFHSIADSFVQVFAGFSQRNPSAACAEGDVELVPAPRGAARAPRAGQASLPSSASGIRAGSLRDSHWVQRGAEQACWSFPLARRITTCAERLQSEGLLLTDKGPGSQVRFHWRDLKDSPDDHTSWKMQSKSTKLNSCFWKSQKDLGKSCQCIGGGGGSLRNKKRW